MSSQHEQAGQLIVGTETGDMLAVRAQLSADGSRRGSSASARRVSMRYSAPRALRGHVAPVLAVDAHPFLPGYVNAAHGQICCVSIICGTASTVSLT